jgi:predicted phosphodiesterase
MDTLKNYKILVYADVHGNYEALKALYEADDYKTAEKRIFLGDALAFGPRPNECIEAIYDSGDVYLCGNHEYYYSLDIPKENLPEFFEKYAHQRYTRSILTAENRQKMSKKFSYSVTVGNKKLYFCHYAWDKNNYIVDNPEIPTVENMAEIFNDIDADYIFFGHEHFPFYLHGDKHYICVGAVGMLNPANYVLITVTGDNICVEHKTVNYDAKKVQQQMLDENYPKAAIFYNWLNKR